MKSNTEVGRKIPADRFAIGCFGDVGYVVKRPGHGIKTEKLIKSYVNITNDRFRRVNECQIRKRDAFVSEYWRKFDLNMARASVKLVVQLGLDQAKMDLEHKKNKLKGVLLEEQCKQLSEYTRKAQVAFDKRMDATKRRAEEILKRSDESDRKRAEEVYAKVAMENSEEYRRKVVAEMLKSTQETNEEIIRTKHIQKLCDADDDFYWSVEAEKRALKEMKFIEMEEALRKDSEMIQRQNLIRQLEDQSRKKRNEVCIEELAEIERKVIRDRQYRELNLRTEEAKRRESLSFQALIEQIEQNKALAKRKQDEEILVDKIMQADNMKTLERERAAIENQRIQNLKELVIFRQSMVEYKNACLVDTQEAEKTFEECSKAIELEKYRTRRVKENAKKALAVESFEVSKRMAAKNEAEAAAMEQQHLQEIELAGHYNKMSNMLSDASARNKFKEKNPTPYNDESVKYLEVLQERERLKDATMLENMRRKEGERQREVMRILERPVHELGNRQHPMYKYLKSQQCL